MRRAVSRQLQATLAALAPDSAPVGDGAGATGATPEEMMTVIVAAASEANDRRSAAEMVARRLVGALDRIGQGVVVCDETGAVVFRNAEAATLVRARGGDIIAEQAVREALAHALDGGRPEQTLERFVPHRRTLLIRAFPLVTPPRGRGDVGRGDVGRGAVGGGAVGGGANNDDGPGEITGAVAVVDDVSQRRRLEDVRRDFVANVSHELKTPVGALSLLAETLDGEDDPEVVGRLSARVAAEADRLGRIIDDLLDLSRIEENETPVQEQVPIRRLLGEAIEPLRPVARSHDVELSVIGVAPALAVPGDRRDLVSAVSNLVDNAIKYSEPASRVVVEVTWGRQWLDIAVTDQGIGIPSRDIERVFERFYRVDRARSRSTGGTGLGLSIVRHVAVNHGGSVCVRSVEGEGSTFTLRLPVDRLPADRLPGDRLRAESAATPARAEETAGA